MRGGVRKRSAFDGKEAEVRPHPPLGLRTRSDQDGGRCGSSWREQLPAGEGRRSLPERQNQPRDRTFAEVRGWRSLGRSLGRCPLWCGDVDVVRGRALAPYVRVFMRGFLLVSLVSLNTTQIAAGNFPGAFVVGAAISLVWWSNSSKS